MGLIRNDGPFFMNIYIDYNILYVLQNVFIVLYLMLCWTWSLANQNNIFQKIIALKFFKEHIMYLGLWHSWNMFINPTRYNFIIYALVIMQDGEERLEHIYYPAINIILEKCIYVRDTKYMESMVNDTYLQPFFAEFAFNYFNKKYSAIKKVKIIYTYEATKDFFTNKKQSESMKILCEYPK